MIDKAQLEKLHSLLISNRNRNEQKNKNTIEKKQTVEKILREYDIISPSQSNVARETEIKKSIRQRHMPLSTLSMPICTPSLTTIVPLNTLPKAQRSLYLSRISFKSDNFSDVNDDENTLVEIRTCDLLTPFEQEQQSSGKGERANHLSQRPLAGNLSSKLVEYTRGRVGNRRPFKPGGSDDDDLQNDTKTNETNTDETYEPNLSPIEMKMAIEVIKKGSIDSWKDGSLITAPPGVSFKVGLCPRNVDDLGVKGCNNIKGDSIEDSKQSEDLCEESEQNDFVEAGTWISQGTDLVTVTKMWDKSYFEEDSLFGDESSGDDESQSSDDEESNDESNEKESQDGEDNVADVIPSNDQQMNDKPEAEEIKDDVDDIDAFLSELEFTATSSNVDKVMNEKRKKKVAINQSRTVKQERKCWAVTTLLNLEDFHSIVPNPAITYSFELDGFQKQAVARLERGECIFVAAHTSAGKTVCAEYAIALARKHCTRAIYTSPIKALSNQKYRDFRDKFGDDVGLITGDLQINADSSCLIMTTEILRSMLYRGADLIRDIEWVIFDEVHYINDSERGVVWEEVIIMLPDYVNLIFLSATTPNTIEFSDWIGKTKKKPVHVIRTNYRPVPLSHHLYAGNKLYKIMEGTSGFFEKGYKEAAKALLPASERDKKQQGAKKGQSRGNSAPSFRKASGSAQSAWQQAGSRQNWTALIKFLDREGLMPTVVFSFSKKKCEEIAGMLRTLDLNTAVEKNAARAFSIQTRARLSPNDANLPQVITICEMVQRGIAVHHGGMLPILKEMVEILFSRNLIKVLFATETFAMGVNMPARAVVFNSIRKHDGTKFRFLEPGEYTQMAGRAGRRGLDQVGTVIMCCFGDEPPPQVSLRNMLTGSSTKLQSQFRLTYNMIMNLLRVEDMSVEGMIKRSFSEFATQRALTTNEYPKLLKRGLKALATLDENFKQDADSRIGAEDVEEYFFASSSLLSLTEKLLSYFIGCSGASGGGSLVPGRIIYVTASRSKGFVRAPAIVVKSPVSTNAPDISASFLICIVLLPTTYVPSDNNKSDTGNVKECQINFIGESRHRHYVIKRIELDEILYVSFVKHKVDSSKLYKEEVSKRGERAADGFFASTKPRKIGNADVFGFGGIKPLGKRGKVETKLSGNQDQAIDEIVKYLQDAEEKEGEIKVMDLSECTKGARQGDEVLQVNVECRRVFDHVSLIRTFKSHKCPNLQKHYTAVERKETLRQSIQTLRHLLSNESLQLFPDFLQRKALLRTLNYIDNNDTVCVKGRVACEVNTCEEIIVTELIFEGILNELDPAEIAAALSALIFQEKTSDFELDSELPERLQNTCEQMKTIATNLGQQQSDHGLQIDPNDYCEKSLKFGLVHVVYEWASGVPFSNICELTLVQEGSIVRTITRLDELCREVRNAARVVGNPTLYRKMEEASVAIKRDIVFASSLYIT